MSERDILQVLLKDKIASLGISEREAARRIGKSATTVSRILAGDPADIETLIAVCDWLGVSPSHILDAYLPGTGQLGAEIAAIVEQNPELERVFKEALALLKEGRIEQGTVDDLLAYAAYRLRLGEVHGYSHQGANEDQAST
jgi:transcriptional regulator with XRE-family HTH domain